MTVTLNDLKIKEVLDYIYDLFKPEADKKGIRLIKNTDIPIVICTDKEKLIAVLTNLLKNAIKFCHAGSIEFGYITQERSVQFFVKDTGIGISKEKIKHIFERFIRVDHEMSPKYEGTGLGLSIAKGYVDMLGGEIWVDSELGLGSQFYFTLPLRRL